MALSKTEILTNLIGIGITFTGVKPNFKDAPVVPELTIIQSLSLAKNDLLILQLLHTWIQNNHALIHAETLSKLALSITNKVELALLGGLLAYTEDKRFNSLINKIRKIEIAQNSEIDKTLSLAAKIGQFPYDKFMIKFGVMITELEKENNKKFLNRSQMTTLNPFFKCRILFGTNSRADVAALMLLGFENPTTVKNILNCSYETAHRNVNNLKEAQWPQDFVSDVQLLEL